MKEFSLLGSTLGNSILRKNEGCRIVQLALQRTLKLVWPFRDTPQNQQGGRVSILRQLTVTGCGLPWGRHLTLSKGTFWLSSISREMLSTGTSVVNIPGGRRHACLGHEGEIGTTCNRICQFNSCAFGIHMLHIVSFTLSGNNSSRILVNFIRNCYCSVTKSFLTLCHPRNCTQQAPCPSLSPWVCWDFCPLSQWYHPAISSSVEV